MKSKRVDKARALINSAIRINDEAIMIFSKSSNPMNIADMVWEAYSKLEYAIILLKLDLGVEFSQRQESLEDPSDVGGLLVKASDNLVNALNKMNSDLHEVLMNSRSARDALKLALFQIEKGNL
ncbi:MAG: hypothetical protein ACPLY9_02485 [Nitrososphaerales archaeon]